MLGRLPGVGDIVLFRLDSDVQRPLLVVLVESEHLVSGELFFSWEEDRETLWCRDHCFYSPSKDVRSMAVCQIPEGPEVGAWEHKPQAPVDAGAMARAAEAARAAQGIALARPIVRPISPPTKRHK